MPHMYTVLKYGALVLAFTVFASTFLPEATRNAMGPWRDAVGGGIVLACMVAYAVAEVGLEAERRKENGERASTVMPATRRRRTEVEMLAGQ